MRRAITHGERIPRFYGVAWEEHYKAVAVCFPVPLNLLFGLVHRWWWQAKHGIKPATLFLWQQRALEAEDRCEHLRRIIWEKGERCRKEVGELQEQLRVTKDALRTLTEEYQALEERCPNT